METQDILNTEIGTQEFASLKPARVKIEAVRIDEVFSGQNKEKKVGDKLVCIVRHPDSKDPAELSGIKYEAKGGKLKTSGLWVTKDTEGKLQKGSALTSFLVFLKANKMSDLVGKEADTTLDENNYLCFKAY